MTPTKDPVSPERVAPEETARFWASVSVRGHDECWPWTGAAVKKDGRGVFHVQGRNVVAARYMWALLNGPIPGGLLICHRCDNPPCVNPNHLWLGTNSDNLNDAAAKGRLMLQRDRSRVPIGSAHSQAKLTEDQVATIKAKLERGEKISRLALDYGVSKRAVRFISAGETWAHVVARPQTEAGEPVKPSEEKQ